MNWIKNILNAGDIVREVTNGADKLFTSKAEKKELEIKMEKVLQDKFFKAEEMANEDRANARKMNEEVQDSENASWLAKNTAYLLDIGMFLFIIGIVIALIFIDIPVGNKEILYLVVGTLLGLLGATWTFHRGSSSGSKEKNNLISKLKK